MTMTPRELKELELLEEVERGDRDPWVEGVEAAQGGKSDTSNPYPVLSDAHLSWNDGYFSVAGPDEP